MYVDAARNNFMMRKRLPQWFGQNKMCWSNATFLLYHLCFSLNIFFSPCFLCCNVIFCFTQLVFKRYLFKTDYQKTRQARQCYITCHEFLVRLTQGALVLPCASALINLSPALFTQMSTYKTRRVKRNCVLVDRWSRAFTRYFSLSLSPRSDASDSTCLHFILCRCSCLLLSAQDDTITCYFMSKWWLKSPSYQLNLECDLSPPSSLVTDSDQV